LIVLAWEIERVRLMTLARKSLPALERLLARPGRPTREVPVQTVEQQRAVLFLLGEAFGGVTTLAQREQQARDRKDQRRRRGKPGATKKR
jgi:hypothetical protein